MAHLGRYAYCVAGKDRFGSKIHNQQVILVFFAEIQVHSFLVAINRNDTVG